MARKKLSAYQKYLNKRSRLEDKGYILKEAMTEIEYNHLVKYVDREIRSGELITKKTAEEFVNSGEKYFSKSQAKALKMGINDMLKEKGVRDEFGNIRQINVDFIYKNKETMSLIDQFMTWKGDKTLIGGHYE